MSDLINNPTLADAFSKVLGGLKEPAAAEPTPTETGQDSEAAAPADQNPPTPADPKPEDQQQAAPPVPVDPKPEVPIYDEAKLFEQHFRPMGFEKGLEEVKSLIKDFDALYNSHETLKTENAKLKAEPHFADENDKRLFDYVKTYKNHDKRGFSDYLEIDGTNPDSIADEEAMRLAFVTTKKNLSREDANRLFNRELSQKYTATEEMDDEERELVRIARTEAAAEARQKLRELKSQFGQKPATNEPSPDQRAADAVIERGVQDRTREWEESLAKTLTFTVKTRTAGEQKVEIGNEERAMLDKILRPIIQNRANYDASGAIKGNVQALVERELQSILFHKAIEVVEREAENRAKEEAYKSIASRSPEKLPTPPAANGEPSPLQTMGNSILAHFKR